MFAVSGVRKFVKRGRRGGGKCFRTGIRTSIPKCKNMGINETKMLKESKMCVCVCVFYLFFYIIYFTTLK